MNVLSLGTTSARQGRAQYELRIGAFVSRELEVVSYEGYEKLSTPYVYDVVFASSVATGLLQAGVFGFPACLSIQVAKREPRVIQGLAVGFESIGAAESELKTKTRRYTARIAPRLWLLNHSRKYRVFQDRSAVQIACAVLEEAGITPEIRLMRSEYPPIPFMYQRGETDLEFLHHVLAVAGIFYYFEHANGLLDRLAPGAGELGSLMTGLGGAAAGAASAVRADTTLVLCDRARHTHSLHDASLSAAGGLDVTATIGSTGGMWGSGSSVVADAAPADAIPYDANGQAASAAERIFSFRARSEIRPKRVTLRDWSVADGAGVRMEERSAVASLDASAGVSAVFGFSGQAGVSAGATADLTVDAVPIATADASVMEYQRDAALLKARDQFAEHALSQLRSDRITAHGESDCRRLAPGYRFKLARHPIAPVNTEYVVTGVRSCGFAPDHLPSDASPLYRNTFECVPASVDPRPPKPVPRPPLGVETATVVGPVYDDVHCDSLGRILVRFHWAPPSASSSGATEGTCWVHWQEPWAGHGYGTVHVPRVGSEVVVQFLQQEGGQPIATGQTYTRAHAPPFPLPRKALQVGIRTRTGEISIDDSPGAKTLVVRTDGELRTESRGRATTILDEDFDVTVAKDRREATGGDAVHSFAKDVCVSVNGSFDRQIGKDCLTSVAGSVTEDIAGGVTRHVSGPVTTAMADRCRALFEDDVTEHYLGHRAIIVGCPDHARSLGLHVEGFARCAFNEGEVVVRNGFTLTCGDTRIHVSPKGVTVSAPELVFETKTLTATAKTMTATASDTLSLRGKTLTAGGSSGTVVLDDNAAITGQKVKMSSSSSSSQASSAAASKPPTRVVLTDHNGKPLANKRALVRVGGEGGVTRMVVLDADGAVEIEGTDPLEVTFPEDPDATA